MNRPGPTVRLCRAALALPGVAVLALRAWATLEPEHWSALADRLEPLVAARPQSAWLHLLHGRALRSGRRADEAASACRRSLALRPDGADALLELGRCLKQAGSRDAAIAAMRDAAVRGSPAARRELCRYAARAALPEREPGIYARADYTAFIAANPVPPPPHGPVAACFTLYPATGGALHPLTIQSLGRQAHAAWHLAGTHPPPAWAGLPQYDIVLPHAAILDPQALAWINHAAAATGAAVVRADHDHYDPQTGRRADPVFLPQPDFLWTEGEGAIVRLEAVRRGTGQGAIAQVPLVLLSILREADEAAFRRLPDAEPGRISAIIPTRDNPAMLADAVASLRATAAHPDLVEVVIVDNGSRTREGRAMLDRLAREGAARIVPFDEPFNWSRASNVGAAAATGQTLLFLNDDTVMQTSGWDRILAGLAANPAVGVVGARMLYPDGTIQHGGFVFGMDNGPQHEGRWMPRDDAGPAGRWTATRQAVAVTGAFLAVRAESFAALGGFDENTFRIDFADVDFCLRMRASGKAVAYCGAITLTHHESVSRGLNLGRAKRRRMRAEWRRFAARWGARAELDPGYHPVWARTGAAYDGITQLDILSEKYVPVSVNDWRLTLDCSQSGNMR
ncbi:hypothetical protein NOLU111490_04550 [Novosphingobium lubricantis]